MTLTNRTRDQCGHTLQTLTLGRVCGIARQPRENLLLKKRKKNKILMHHKKEEEKRSEFLKNKCASVRQEGYTEYFLINAKSMKVENADLANVLSDTKKGDIKRIFGKSMKNRTVSRVLLSKFIKRVA